MNHFRLPWPERVAQAWLWWRYSYSFRFAHKPLCGRLGGRVLRIGHVHVCRGCTCLYLGALMAAVLLLPRDLPWGTRLAAAYGCGVPAMLAAMPAVYGRLPDIARDLARVAAGMAAVLLCGFCWWGPWWLGVANIAGLLALRQVAIRRRGARLHRLCDGCPELGGNQVCSGFARQAALARRYEEAASNRLMRVVSKLPAATPR
jgi:hypothetical protein